ncbi:MAG: transglutaminase-like domain-containing protein [Oscillospiraceae bacterium]|nr:transglutaminase-like domain-containing protein [Oscillospiraceae bacterium]
MESYTQKATDEISLAYLRQPSRDVQSDDPKIITLSDTITAGISSEYDKARAIHDWVSSNIWYDFDSLAGISSVEMLPGEERWYSTVVLRNKRGICSGYANLTAALLRAAGIPAKAMSGFAGGAHGWTVTFVEGRWINIDTTWDSKNYYQNGEFSSQQASDNKYFDMSDSEFAKDHTVFYYAD